MVGLRWCWGALRRYALWCLAIVGAVLLPYCAALIGTPAGAFFRGSLRPSIDEGVYLSAVRMGAAGDWLWHDPFAVHSPPPLVMHFTYILAGHLGALLHAAPRTAFMLYHPVAVLLLAFATWRMVCSIQDPSARRWALAFALCTSNFLWLDALLALIDRAPVGLARLEHETVSAFSLGMISGHDAVGVAGHCLALAGVLHVLRDQGRRLYWQHVLLGMLGTLLVGLAYPVYLPLTLAVIGIFFIWWALREVPREVRSKAIPRVLAACSAIAAPGIACSLYYYVLFDGSVWAVFKGQSQVSLAERLLDWGLLLPLGIWGWRRAPRAVRPLATMLALWSLCAVVGSTLNVYQGSRLGIALTLPLGGLFALGLTGRAAATKRRWLAVLGFSLLCQYAFLLPTLLVGSQTYLYDSAPQEQALQWLARHTTPSDVVLAPLFFGNVVPERLNVHVVAGEYYQTYDFSLRYPQLQTFYGATSTTAARLSALHATCATLVVYDGSDTFEGPFDPRGLPGLRTVFVSGDVAILRVLPAPPAGAST